MPAVTGYWDVVREQIGEWAEYRFLVAGAADEAAVRTAIQAAAPATYGGLVLSLPDFGAITIDERKTETEWLCTVRYVKAYAPPDESYDFDTSGGQLHITQNLSTIARYGTSIPTDEKGAIGWDGNNVNGADIIVPKYEFGETHYMYWTPMSGEWAYKLVLMGLTGKVNNAAFRGFAAGEVLFMGARATRTPETSPYWQINYRFAASPNKTGLVVGGITGIAKKGWELMDVRYEQQVSGIVNTTIPVPVCVLIHKVYDEGDFSTLLIGTTI